MGKTLQITAFDCKLCRRPFNRPSKRDEHNCKGRPRFECHICGKKMFDEKSLKRHNYLGHRQDLRSYVKKEDKVPKVMKPKPKP